MPDMDFLPKAEPVTLNVQLQSDPPGAEAKTSVGQSCKTPCAVSVPADKDFSVTFALAGYQPQTVPVQVTRAEALTGETSETILTPNPVAVELEPAPKAPAKKPPVPARKPAAAASAQAPKPAAPATPRPAATAPTRPAGAAPAAVDPWPAVR